LEQAVSVRSESAKTTVTGRGVEILLICLLAIVEIGWLALLTCAVLRLFR
jgi:hypothetical protein